MPDIGWSLGSEHRQVIEALQAENAKLRAVVDELHIERTQAALDRYRYVYHWWASDSYDRGGEFNARMNWARGEDVEQDLTPDQFAKIGHRFLASTGRVRTHEQREPT